tara:strand:- start:86 stop:817 length:732 start_codon:yes stop_codon:yes gene_type:complete
MSTKIRPGSLTSTPARKRLEQYNDPTFNEVIHAIDQMAGIYDGLAAVRENRDPMKTHAAHAVEYKKQFETATAKAAMRTNRLLEALADRWVKAEDSARKNAGLEHLHPGAVEVRETLRGMKTTKERDAAIRQAFNQGDRVIVSAVINAPSPVTLGEVTVPLNALTEDYISRENPGYRDELDATDFAAQALRIAHEGFNKGAGKLRDVPLEIAAAEGAKSAQSAAGKLAAAMNGNVDPAIGEAA